MPWPLLTPGKDPVPIVQEAGWAPGPDWTGGENLARPTGIRSPDHPAHSQSLYRLCYPAHIICSISTLQGSWTSLATSSIHPTQSSWPLSSGSSRNGILIHFLSFGFQNQVLLCKVRLLEPCPTPILETQVLVFICLRVRLAELYTWAWGAHFIHLIQHAWATVELFLNAGLHTG